MIKNPFESVTAIKEIQDSMSNWETLYNKTPVNARRSNMWPHGTEFYIIGRRGQRGIGCRHLDRLRLHLQTQ